MILQHSAGISTRCKDKSLWRHKVKQIGLQHSGFRVEIWSKTETSSSTCAWLWSGSRLLMHPTIPRTCRCKSLGIFSTRWSQARVQLLIGYEYEASLNEWPGQQAQKIVHCNPQLHACCETLFTDTLCHRHVFSHTTRQACASSWLGMGWEFLYFGLKIDVL